MTMADGRYETTVFNFLAITR